MQLFVYRYLYGTVVFIYSNAVFYTLKKNYIFFKMKDVNLLKGSDPVPNTMKFDPQHWLLGIGIILCLGIGHAALLLCCVVAYFV